MLKRILTISMVLVLVVMAACTVRRPEDNSTPPVESIPPEETVTPTAAPKPTVTPEPTPTAEPTPTPIPTEPPYRNPLNGAPLEEPFTDRPFAVMVNNILEAQPQCGVGQADVLYEILTEGGITRMLAIYSDIRSVDHLGSVRSIRPYFIDVSLGYGAVTCHAGGSDAAYSRIYTDRVQNIDGVRGIYQTNVFYRDQNRISSGYAVEHTLFTDGKRLYECAETLNYPLTVDEDYDSGLHFVWDGTPDDGESAENITITFTPDGKTTELHYNDDTGLYTAVQYNKDYADGNTEEQVTFRNVIGLRATHYILDDYGRRHIVLIGSGEGYFACGGKRVNITWKRDSLDDHYHYYLEDGSELQVGTGTTYIAVMSPKSGLEFE